MHDYGEKVDFSKGYWNLQCKKKNVGKNVFFKDN